MDPPTPYLLLSAPVDVLINVSVKVPCTVSMWSQWCVPLLADSFSMWEWSTWHCVFKEVSGCESVAGVYTVFMLCLNCWLFWTVRMLLNSKHTPCPILCWQCHYSDTWHSKKSDVSDSEWATWEHGVRQPHYSCCRVGRWSVSECTQIGVRRMLWCTLSIYGLWFAFPFWSADCSGQWGTCAVV